MEKIIENLERELRDIIENKPRKTLRKDLGDMIDLRLLRMIVFSLQWASVGYQSALRFAGMKFGRRLGMDSNSREMRNLLDEVKTLIESLKDGRIEIEYTLKEKKINFKVFDAALVSSIANGGQSVCFFKEGFIEGYLDGAIKKQGSLTAEFQEIKGVRVEETKCQGKGDKYCQFTIYLS